MKRPLARALTSLHAPGWRRQYGDEFEALLAEMPCTPALLADVVPRAVATRSRSTALLAAWLLLLCVSGPQLAHTHKSSQVAADHVARRRGALAACLSYSSLARNGIIERRQCLD